MTPGPRVDIDPNGDVLAILLEPVESFAPWPSAIETFVNDGEPGEKTAHDEHTLRLSSKHLMLACPRLMAMFARQWKESTEIHADGLRHWDLGDYLDPDAFVIVMNIIHGRNRSVPQKVDLEMLAKICVIIDDLQCHEATEMFSRVWLMAFSGKTPSTYCRDLILWVFVASVLREPDIFLTTTRTAMLHSAQEIHSLGLPIRLDIIEQMEANRKCMIRSAINSLHIIASTLCRSAPRCSYECDAILYGMLIKQMRHIGLPLPGETILDQGFAMESLVNSIRQFRDPTWFSQADVVHQFVPEPEPVRGFSSFGSMHESRTIVLRPNQPVKCLGIGKGHNCTLKALLIRFERLLTTATGLKLPEPGSRCAPGAADQVQTRSCGLPSNYTTPPAVPQHLQGALYYKPGGTEEQNNAARGRNASAIRNDVCEACRRPRSQHPAGTIFKPVRPWRSPAADALSRPGRSYII